MTFRDEQLNKYVNSIFTEASAMSREVDRLRAQGYSDEDIASKGEMYANEIARKNSNTNVNQVISDNRANVAQANRAANDAMEAYNGISENSPAYDAAYEDAVAAQTNAQQVSADATANIDAAKQAAQNVAAAKKAAALDAENKAAAEAQAAKDARLTQLKAANADKYRQELAQQKAEYEKALAELEDYKKQVAELEAKAKSGDENAENELAEVKQEVAEQEQAVEQEKQDVAEAEQQVEAAGETPATPETPAETPAAPAAGATEATPASGAAPTNPDGTLKTPEQTAQEVAAANDKITNDAMTVKPTDDPATQAAKQTFQGEWAALKSSVSNLQTMTKQIMSSPAAATYMKARPDLTSKFQKFGGALASVGAILGIAGTIAMFIPGGQAIGALLKAGGMLAGGVGGATASGATAVNQFKNGNVLGGIGSLAAGAAAAGMAVGGATGLGNSINSMRGVNSTGTNVVSPAGTNPTEAAPAAAETPAPAAVPGTNPAQITDKAPTIENSNAAVAAAKPGDVLQRNDGTRIEINQGDINYAKAQLAQAPATAAQPAPVAQTQPVQATQPLFNATNSTGSDLTFDLDAYKAFQRDQAQRAQAAQIAAGTGGQVAAGDILRQMHAQDNTSQAAYNAYKQQNALGATGANTGFKPQPFDPRLQPQNLNLNLNGNANNQFNPSVIDQNILQQNLKNGLLNNNVNPTNVGGQVFDPGLMEKFRKTATPQTINASK